MILTPEERRALLVLLALLLFGQGLALWEEHRRGRPDRELSRWLTVLAATRGDSCSAVMDSLYAAGTADDLSPSGGAERRSPEVRAQPAELIPPGVLESGRIRINSASAEHLEMLPGVGPVLARRIADDRDVNGPFRVPEDLLRVSGIGPRKLAGLEAEVDWAVQAEDGVSAPDTSGQDALQIRRLPVPGTSG